MAKQEILTPSRDLEPEDLERLEKLASLLEQVPGVRSARAWTRVPTRARVYVELVSRNRQRCFDQEAGRRLVVHLDTRMQYTSPWAGGMTRDWHAKNGTWDRIQEIAKRVLLAF
jgi:hypothetical protein